MRSSLWRSCAERFLKPQLGDDWRTSKTLLYHQPNDWFICALWPRQPKTATWFQVVRLVQFLPIPASKPGGIDSMPLSHRGDYPTAPTTISEAGPVMERVLADIRDEALPHFRKRGNVSGYFDIVEPRSRRAPDNMYRQEELLYLTLLQGDLQKAQRIESYASVRAREIGEPFAIEIAERIDHVMGLTRIGLPDALDQLRTQASETLAAIT
ncbi:MULTISPECIES: hypothetical protein [Catenuloplanes]|uniref:Uncharacterized protein n=1 Tax=Catenuloplanes niger TaxID=587534 RepID=A0AAE3ZJN0_9ACTN|nr:hypothetical protein [Catenuloplanes niger]MDR7319926.1 hypothetical protein [Catenuloplanes niger]